jgi:hypothetical protein
MELSKALGLRPYARGSVPAPSRDRKGAAQAVKALIVLAAALPLLGAEYRVKRGTLTIDERGVSYQETEKKQPRHFSWSYQDIQQLEVAPARVRVLTYKDNPRRLGADFAYTFEALPGQDFTSSYALLKDRLDQRFVAELADAAVQPLWSVPVKLRGTITGSEGTLAVGRDRIVYSTERKGASRTWRFGDIDNISTSGPFELTLTTFERALEHYGSRKDFNFQLKEPLDERRYNELWRTLHHE